jgi:tetratricopeptide (TPR) repeat protein
VPDAQPLPRRRAIDARFRFHHRLTRDAAYYALLTTNRQRLHSAAADMLLARRVPGAAEDSVLVNELWQHLAAAGRYAEAHRWSCMAFYTAQSPVQEVRIYKATLDLWREACAVSEGEGSGSPHCLSLEAVFHERAGRQGEAATLRWRAFDVALATGELDFAARYLAAEAMRAVWRGEFEASRDFLLRATAVRPQEPHERFQMRLEYIQCHRKLAEGQFEEALGELEALTTRAIRAGDLTWELEARSLAAVALSDLNRAAEAVSTWHQVYALAVRLGDLRGQSEALFELGTLDSRAGNHASAVARIRQALALARETGSPMYVALALLALGRAELACGAGEDAQAPLNHARLLFEQQEREGEAMLARVLTAIIIARQGGTAEVRDVLAAAEELCQRRPDAAHLLRRELPQLRAALGG